MMLCVFLHVTYQGKIMKNLAKSLIIAFLATIPLMAKDTIKINFDTMESYNRSVPAIHLAYKTEAKVAFILSYANNIFNFEKSLVEHVRVRDMRLVLNYRF